MRNLTFAWRTLWKTPIVSLVAILSLALGIGANTAIFSLFEQVLLRPLPVPEPERLVNLSSNGPRSGSNSTNNAGGTDLIYSYPMFRDLERTQTVFTGLAAFRSFGANLSHQGQTSSASGLLVSGSYFPVLALNPAAGRLLSYADDKTIGAHSVVVLSHAYWTEKFNRNLSILGQPLLVNGVIMTVVGVAPAGFRGTTLGELPDIFVPLTMRPELFPTWEGFEERRNYWAYLFARLKPGLSLEQAQASINIPFKGILRDTELTLQKGSSERGRQRFLAQTMTLQPGLRGHSSLREEAQTPVYLLLGITGFVLLIACANIANLLLARSAQRTKEFSIRLSLGATRGQLMRQLLSEALLLAVLAAITGIGLAYATSQGILALLPPDGGEVFSTALDSSTLLFAIAVALLSGFLFGLFPAVHSSRQDLSGAMKDQAANVSSTTAATRFRQTLVTAQIALSLLLLISAGLFLKSLVNVTRVGLGIDTQNTICFALSPALNRYTPQRSVAFFEALEQKLLALPGVSGATVSLVQLIAGNNWGSNVSVDGFQAGPDTDTHSMFNGIGPGYFRTLGIPLLAGREFTTADNAAGPQVAIVNEAFARKFSPSSSIVGKQMQRGSGGKNDILIVGLARDTKYSDVKRAVPPVFYLPYRQDKNLSTATVYVKSTVPTAQVVPSLRQAVASLDPNLPLEDLKTLDAQIAENITLDRMISTLAAAFAGLATLLAAVGLYGVLAFTVARRTREIGIRLAVGADTGSIRNLVLREVVIMVAIGTALGVPAALALSKYTESLLYDLKGNDPVVLASSVLLVAAVSLLAGYIPARKAMRVDPMDALRYE